MNRGSRLGRRESGVSTSEAILLMPFFLLFSLGTIQLAQLATAMIISNYAASSFARKAVQQNYSGGGDAYNDDFEKLLSVGMKSPRVFVTSEGGLMQNMQVHACAEVTAFPFVSHFLGLAIVKGLGGPSSSSSCPSMDGPFGFRHSQPAVFVVHGKATARMNYRP